MQVIKYFKLDIKFSYINIILYLAISLILILYWFIFDSSTLFSVAFFNFTFFTTSISPFNNRNNYTLKQFYHILPYKNINIFLGRYLYLFAIYIHSLLINISFLLISVLILKNNINLIYVFIIQNTFLLLSLIIYTLNFLIDSKKNILNSIPFIVIFFFSIFSTSTFINTLFKFIKYNATLLLFSLPIIIVFITFLSFFLSIKNCNKKEVKV